MYVHVYIHNTKESLALNLEIGKTNWCSIVIADIRDSTLSLAVSHLADLAQFWSAIFMFSSESGRWQAVISSTVFAFYICGRPCFAIAQESDLNFRVCKLVRRWFPICENCEARFTIGRNHMRIVIHKVRSCCERSQE